MGDLISRNTLTGVVKKYAESTAEGSALNAFYEDMLRVINEQPTAYDVEKVVAELEEAYNDHGDTTEHYKEYVEKIIRNGGKE